VTFCATTRSRYFVSLTINLINEPTDPLRLLKLMQLADSTLPIGSAAHSFGLESLIAEELLSVDTLSGFLGDYLEDKVPRMAPAAIAQKTTHTSICPSTSVGGRTGV
jgi:urease accessory protein UreF